MKPEHIAQHTQEDPRILAAWLENTPEEDTPRWEVHLAIGEQDFATFYSERDAWLSPFDPVHIQDIDAPWRGSLVLTRDGAVVTVVLETWGSLPERPRRHVRILFDRTGRLRERLRPWEPRKRVDFSLLDRLAADVWLNLWAAALLHARDPAGCANAIAAALRAYLAFVAACRGQKPEDMAWEGTLTQAAGLNAHVAERPLREVAHSLVELMSTHARALGESRGWTYPQRLEETVRETWQQVGWGGE